MIKRKIYTKLLGTLLFLTTISNAGNVKLATDGTGDFLLAPLYIAQGDICTEVKVFNTNETNSILAKVVFREQIASHEVDFPIFLSPGDVWTGLACQRKEDGIVCLTSIDDSNHPAAIQTLRFGQNLDGHSRNASYRHADMAKGFVEIEGKSYEIQESQKDNINFSKGYIEVFPIAQFNERSSKKVSKDILVERWDSLERGDPFPKSLLQNGVDNNSLSGIISFQTAGQETSSVPMTAFENAHDKQLVGEAISYNSDADADVLLGVENKKKILKLLQKSNISFVYDNCGVSQFLHIAFPFSHKEIQTRRYKLIIRDLQENKYSMIFSPLPKLESELAVFSIEDLVNLTRDRGKFREGMIEIKELRNNDITQLGRNKIPSILPTLSRISNIGSRALVINSVYVPTK